MRPNVRKNNILFYIGLSKDGQANNFASFRPRKNTLNIEIKLPYSEDIQKIIEDNELNDMGYQKRWGLYRLRVEKEDVKIKREILKVLLLKAYETYK